MLPYALSKTFSVGWASKKVEGFHHTPVLIPIDKDNLPAFIHNHRDWLLLVCNAKEYVSELLLKFTYRDMFHYCLQVFGGAEFFWHPSETTAKKVSQGRRISRITRFLLCLGQDFAFYLNAFSEVYQQAYFYAGGFQVVNELGAVGRMEVFDGFQFEDDFVFNKDKRHAFQVSS